MAPVLLLVIATAAFGQKQSTHPPRDLHRVGSHYTAYNPPDPSTYPADAKTHEIKAGDTLWALAQKYYGNAYLWPQLWESNTWITDAHWIYPGDVLLVGGEGTAAGAAAKAGSGNTPELASGDTSNVFTETTGSGAPVAQIGAESRPIPLATESDIYCYGYIGDPNEPMPNYFESIEDVETMYVPRQKPAVPAAVGPGDLIYIHGDATTGLVAGETYIAVQPGDLVNRPGDGAVLGRRYRYVGQIRILCTEEGRSRAIVTQACTEIDVGARLKPMPQLPIPIARIPDMPAWCDAPTGRTNGYVVDTRDWTLGVVEGNLVQVDLGSADQVQPGDFLTVYRPSTLENQPRVVLGELGILTTEAHTATAIVVSARREIVVGDRVEMR